MQRKSTAEQPRRSNSRRVFFPQPSRRRAYFLRLASTSLGAAAFALQDAALWERDPAVSRPQLRLSVRARDITEQIRRQANQLERRSGAVQ
jgi:hypothetical protein